MDVTERQPDGEKGKGKPAVRQEAPITRNWVSRPQLTLHVWLSLLALGLALWFIISYSDFLLELLWIVFGAVLIGVGVRQLARRLASSWLPDSLAVTGIFLAGLLAVIVPAMLLVPLVKDEATLLREALGQLGTPSPAGLLPSTSVLLQDLGQRLDTLFASALGTVTGLSQLLIDVTVMLFLAYFLSVGASAEEWLLRWLPDERRPAAARFIERVRGRLARWLWAQLGLALYFALTISGGLLLLKVPYALTIGLVAGLLGLIPYVGALVAAVLAGISALSVSPQVALWSVLLILALSSLALHLIAPLLYGRTMRLPVAAMLLALLLGARILGLAGIFFAAPAAVVLLALLEQRGAASIDDAVPVPTRQKKEH